MKFLLIFLACLIIYGIYEIFIGFNQDYLETTNLFTMCRSCNKCYNDFGDIWNQENLDINNPSLSDCIDCKYNCNNHIKYSHQMFVLFFLTTTIPLVISLMFFEPVHKKCYRFEM